MDSKPLLQDRPPAYANVVPGAYEYGQQHNYGAIPAQPLHPRAFNSRRHIRFQEGPSAQMGPAIAQQPYPGTYTIIQPSVVVVGGCPACR
ncbi:unnamed protein product [Oncorhynchus mykiss]|uniref:Uncharacterized protein n=1 Tax=Oncorhynchus mykiss TaxID=8022 RepID=A0A060YWA6_ONCMY|nr:unnamed protein product [Oncorhynchus mykiss]